MASFRSAAAAFAQGAAVGAMIRGIPVANNQFAGDSFDWLRLLPLLCGVGLMLGYALLGAGWLVLKTDGAVRDWAWRRIPWLTTGALVVLCIAFVAALGERDRIVGAGSWALVFPCIGLLAIFGIFASLRRRRDSWPFTLTVVFFVAAFLTLAVMFWPYMIPYTIRIGNAAASEPACPSCSGVLGCSYCP